MNKKILSLLLICASSAVVACDGNTSETPTPSESITPSEDTSTPSESTTVESSTPSESTTQDSSTPSTPVEDEYNKLPNWQETSVDISIGQDLLDPEVGRAFMTGCEYNIYFQLGSSLPNDPNKQVVESSNEKVFTIEKVAGGYKLTALHAGEAYLRITDSNGFIRYCKLISVTDPIDLDYMEEYLVYDCDYWISYGWSDTFVLTFYEGGKYSLSGTLSGSQFTPVTGTYEYVETINNGKEYSYIFTDTDIQALSLVGFHVAANGGFIYLQAESWTEAILLPSATIEENPYL